MVSQDIEIRVPEDQQEGTRYVLQGWLKQPGDAIKAYEPIAELETDKVVVELSAPADGVVASLLKQPGDEVVPGELVAMMGSSRAGDEISAAGAAKVPEVQAVGQAVEARQLAGQQGKTSPAVRRMLSEHKLTLEQLVGTGRGGRVTARDVETCLKSGSQAPKAKSARGESSSIRSHFVPHDPMRKRIAAHMQHSVQTAPHVTTVFEADLSAILAHKARWAPELASKGERLTLTAYFVAASALAMGKVPVVNSRWHDDKLEVFDDVNIGVGTALGERGLMVPVLRNTQDMDLYEVARELERLTGKARDGSLAPKDVQGGTFTISNHGVSGSLIASPIVINQPQSAILGVGKLEKRVIVREVDGQDSIQVRPMCYVTLTLDHRVLDGFQANSFLDALVTVLENWSVDSGSKLPG
ncbi:MAG: 2-oxo acid dehydrogenase subunit E2 [Chromatiales bacterium]|nr:2-oxo acid dehydrogenase subunit E2 [Chromatiales bacterium]